LGKEFPKVVTSLPEADIGFKGLRGWIAQGENHQIVFFDIESLGEVTEHSHDSHQWGMVVEGIMELTINRKTGLYKKGDEYYIPANVKHSAKFPTRCRVIDFFGEKLRYRPKIR